MKRHQFTRSYTNRDKLPFDAPRLALALKYLYDEFAAKPDRPALPMNTQIENPDFPKPQNPSASPARSACNIEIEGVPPSSSGQKPPVDDEWIPIQAKQDRKRTADQRIEELEKKLKEKDEALQKEKESRAEMKRVIKLGLSFLASEQDWDGKNSPKISYRKIKMVGKDAGINLSQTTEEKLSSVSSAKKQRLEEGPEKEDV